MSYDIVWNTIANNQETFDNIIRMISSSDRSYREDMAQELYVMAAAAYDKMTDEQKASEESILEVLTAKNFVMSLNRRHTVMADILTRPSHPRSSQDANLEYFVAEVEDEMLVEPEDKTRIGFRPDPY